MTGRHRECIERYSELGWRVYPAKGKRPIISDWPNRAAASLDVINAEGWFDADSTNVAIATGPESGVFVIDVDAKEDDDGLTGLDHWNEILLANEELPSTYTVRTGSGGLHLYFRYPDGILVKSRNNALASHIDVKGFGGGVIAPPSIHPDTGEAYSVMDDGPVIDAPGWLLGLCSKAHTDSGRRDASVRMGSPSGRITEGGRNEHLYKRGCFFRNKIADPDELLDVMMTVNAKECDPPLEDDELMTIVESIVCKFDAQPDDAFDINRKGSMDHAECMAFFARFKHVLNNGRAVAMDSDQSMYSLRNGKEAFRHLYVQWTDESGKSHRNNAFEYWWDHVDSRYSGIVFDPSNRHSPDKINLWTGFAVDPDPTGDCSLFEEHIRENVAGEDADIEGFVWDWMAQMVQQATNKIGIVLVLRGDQGVGKSILGQILGHLYGPRHFQTINSIEGLTKRFNTDLASLMLVMADEAIWGGQRSVQSKLKNIITDPRITIEPKGLPQYTVDSYLRILMTSNEDWVAPVEVGDRRYAVIDVRDNRRSDRSFFGAMKSQLENDGGYGKLLQLLESRDISGCDWSRIPETPARTDNIINGFDDVTMWIYESLLNGYEENLDYTSLIRLSDAGAVGVQDALRRFRENRSASRSAGYVTEVLFGRKIRSNLGLERVKVTRSEVKREYCYKLESVHVLRSRFCKANGLPDSIWAESAGRVDSDEDEFEGESGS